jgi:hypothetical protein
MTDKTPWDDPYWRGLAARLVSAIEGYAEAYQREAAVMERREPRLQAESDYKLRRAKAEPEPEQPIDITE